MMDQRTTNREHELGNSDSDAATIECKYMLLPTQQQKTSVFFFGIRKVHAAPRWQNTAIPQGRVSYAP